MASPVVRVHDRRHAGTPLWLRTRAYQGAGSIMLGLTLSIAVNGMGNDAQATEALAAALAERDIAKVRVVG